MSDDLGDRMKAHEAVTRHLLPRRTYTVLRVDGKAFHSYTRGLERPFDLRLVADMNAVAEALCKEVSGAVMAYTQSDEISLLATDFGSEGTQPWLGGVMAKWTSIAASVATAELNARRPGARALFDARVFTLPSRTEVGNYFLWRQQDCVRNSISMTAQAYFSHKQLQGRSSNQMQEMLWQDHGVNWNDTSDDLKRGRVTIKAGGERDVTYYDKRIQQDVRTTAFRTWWETVPAPHFVARDGEWLFERIPSA